MKQLCLLDGSILKGKDQIQNLSPKNKSFRLIKIKSRVSSYKELYFQQ